MNPLEKLSAADVNHLLLASAEQLRAAGARIRELEDQVGKRDRLEHAEKIAAAAVKRGIMEEEAASEYAQHLSSGNDDLSVVEAFVSRTTSGVPLGNVMQKTAGADGSNAEDSFINELLTIG